MSNYTIYKKTNDVSLHVYVLILRYKIIKETYKIY